MKPVDDEPTQPIRTPVSPEAVTGPIRIVAPSAPVEPAAPAAAPEPAPAAPAAPARAKKTSFADSVWKLLQTGSLRPEEAETVRRAVKALDRTSEGSTPKLARGSRRMAYVDGEPLVVAGDRSTDLFVLLDGEAVVEIGDAVVERLRVGEVFGEIGLLAGTPRAATVRAEGRVIALRIPADLIDDRLREALWSFAAERRFRTASPITDPDQRRVWYTSARMHRVEPGTWQIASPWIFLYHGALRVNGREVRAPIVVRGGEIVATEPARVALLPDPD